MNADMKTLARHARTNLLGMAAQGRSGGWTFTMRQNGHDFTIGLTTVLAAVIHAERVLAVPLLPDEWVIGVYDTARRDRSVTEPHTARLAYDGIIGHMECDKCTEEYVFRMSVNGRDLSIGLKLMLSSLAFAQQRHAVPNLPDCWWLAVSRRY